MKKDIKTYQHAPTPWTFVENKSICQDTPCKYFVLDANKEVVLEYLTKENAEFIVLCVNGYCMLVDALKKINGLLSALRKYNFICEDCPVHFVEVKQRSKSAVVDGPQVVITAAL